MTDDRSAFTEAREVGLQRRHETREARAIRRAVAEEIATAIVTKGRDETPRRLHAAMRAGQDLDDARVAAYRDAADVAREIGSKENS